MYEKKVGSEKQFKKYTTKATFTKFKQLKNDR